MSKKYVYGLAYPDGRLFYVGKGTGDERMDFHEYEAPVGDRPKHLCILEIWANGDQVRKEKLATFDTDEEALWYERALIFLMPQLTNVQGRGRSVGATPERVPRKITITPAITLSETGLRALTDLAHRRGEDIPTTIQQTMNMGLRVMVGCFPPSYPAYMPTLAAQLRPVAQTLTQFIEQREKYTGPPPRRLSPIPFWPQDTHQNPRREDRPLSLQDMDPIFVRFISSFPTI